MPDNTALKGQDVWDTQQKEYESIVPVARNKISASEEASPGYEQTGVPVKVYVMLST